MPREEYNPLRQLLLEPGVPAVKALADLCRTDRQPLATCKNVYYFDVNIKKNVNLKFSNSFLI